jgi:hypothetical protein
LIKEKERRDMLQAAEERYRATLKEELDLKAMKKEREAREAKKMQEWDEHIDPVAIPDGTPFKFGELVEGGSVKILVDGEEEPQTVPLGDETLTATVEALLKEMDIFGGVVMAYVTGEGDDRKVTGFALLDPPAPPAADEADQ